MLTSDQQVGGASGAASAVGGRDGAAAAAASGVGAAGMGASALAGHGAGDAGGAPRVAGAAGDKTAPDSLALHGRVIDTRRRPMEGARVSVGKQTVLADASGDFEIPDVLETYDLSVVIDVRDYQGSLAHHAWLLEGLHRRDPTIQIYPAPDVRTATIRVHGEGAPSPLPDGQQAYVAFGGPDGDIQATALDSTFEVAAGAWSGPAAISGVLHALLVKVLDEPNSMPIEFLSHDARPLALQDGSATDAFADFTQRPQSGTVSGSVVSHGGSRANWVALRWADGAALRLGADRGADTYTLTVPSLADASIAVVALEGNIEQPPYAVGFADGVAMGASAVTIAIPTTPTLRAPGDAQPGVSAGTSFEWSTDRKVSVLRISAKETADELFIVTERTVVRLPTSEVIGYALPSNAEFSWRVEAHSDAPSIDDAAGNDGLLSAFWDDRLRGPKRGPGSFAVTEQRSFTTAR